MHFRIKTKLLHKYYITYFQLPPCLRNFGFCHRCSPTDKKYHYHLNDPSRHLWNYTQHVLHGRHIRIPDCPLCGKRFKQRREAEVHYCTRMQVPENAVRYTLYPLNSDVGSTITKLKPHQQYDLCHGMKAAISNVFPALHITSANRKFPWRNFSNPNGTKFLKEVLAHLQQLPPPIRRDHILLHKNILVVDDENKTYPIPEQVIRPNEENFIVENSEDDLSYIVRLRHDLRTIRDQPLMNHMELTLLQSYSTSNGFEFMPHRYPLKYQRTVNSYRNVETMDEFELTYLTFMEPLKFWIFCQTLFSKYGFLDVDGRHRQLSLKIPSIALLGLMKIRHGKSLQMLSIAFKYGDEARLSEYCWAIKMVLIEEHLPICRTFTTNLYSEERVNTIFESAMNDAPPLFQHIANNVADPLGI